jgi:hypothetical protein
MQSGKAFHEYLELFEYFGRGGAVRLSRAEFDALDAEWHALVALLADGATPPEQAGRARRRLAELASVLLRDRS